MTIADDQPLSDLPDRAIRDSLRHGEHLRTFLRRAVPDLADGFDCTRARLLDREFPLDDWRRREADLPFEIPYRTGTGEQLALVILLIEHQSDTDAFMPLRLLLFAVLYWDRQWREWQDLPAPRPPLRLRPVLPIVLYTGEAPWGSNRTLADLLGEPEAVHVFAPVWQPLFWNLADQTPEALLNTGEEWLQMLAVIRVQHENREIFEEVFTEAVRRLEVLYGRDHARWYDLMRIVLTWVLWRRPVEEREALLAAAQASQVDAARQKEFRTMREILGGTVEEELRNQKRIGQLQNCRTVLRDLLEDRFGALPETLLQRIEETDDLERLRTAVRQVCRLQGLDDVPL